MKTCMRPLALLTLAACVHSVLAGEPIAEVRDMDADGIVTIELVNGDVTISGWDEARFSIEGELSDAAEGFTLRDGNGNIRFEEHVPERSGWWKNSRRSDADSARLDIRIPRSSVLRFEGHNANVDLSDLQGNIDVEVLNGGIVADSLGGVVRLDTVNGAIQAHRLGGRIALGTVNGSIDDVDSSGSRASFSAVNGRIQSNTRSPQVAASNVNGRIELDLSRVDSLEVSTVGGSVDVFAILNEQAQVELSSVGGGITLSLPDTSSAGFRASTAVGGRIRNELSDDEPVQKNRYVNSRSLDFVLNGGNGDVSVHTVSGSIRLKACNAEAC